MPADDLPARRPPARVRVVHALALAGLLGMVFLHTLRELWLAPTGRGTLLVLTVPPLLLCLRGMLHHRLNTFRWLSLLIWAYVALATLRASTEAGLPRQLAAVELLLCLLVFTASVLYIRWRQKSAAANITPAPTLTG